MLMRSGVSAALARMLVLPLSAQPRVVAYVITPTVTLLYSGECDVMM